MLMIIAAQSMRCALSDPGMDELWSSLIPMLALYNEYWMNGMNWASEAFESIWFQPDVF